MQITQHSSAGSLELRLTGRIDATWAEHLSTSIENAVRSGRHRVVLNFAGVEYISSLGIRVIVVQYKLLKSVKGSLGISHPNESCRNVLTTVGLSELLVSVVPDVPAPTERRPTQTIGGATYETYPQRVSEPLACTLIGEPGRLGSVGFAEDDCRTLTFANGTFGLGLGAFGEGFRDCKGRFGEFLAAGGCAMLLPMPIRITKRYRVRTCLDAIQPADETWVFFPTFPRWWRWKRLPRSLRLGYDGEHRPRRFEL